ncbi:AAA family ATPase [Alicyclobacillus cycloheptanicus]|uniref:Uncharacterized protein YhaN n=1 Tax=Alicyclobacillus cycloheptanicus TaxID=1457 RepID=A0ABT9XEI5_9BACL|nr:AAA family ATPase [Alicyclobacillus cycloheptanicus]MDQ0188692.1 uncharacterized protein YhaN [Alicyclobacillus cycloheptanicus]WDM00636.1 AAA family ATPase [Alicyclobacillus cycloheptanicus]
MKLRGLELYHVGLHQGSVLNDVADGLTVIYGPNEAGKSTLLAGIRALLFGRATQAEAAVSLGAGARVIGRLEDEEGTLWRVERSLSGRRRHPPTASAGDGRRLVGETQFQDQFSALREVEALLYQSVFTFQLAELQDLRDNKSASERLYAAGAAGGLSPMAMERSLAEAAKRLYNRDPRAKNALLLQCMAEMSALRDRLALANDTPDAYLRVKQELAQAMAEQAALQKELEAAERALDEARLMQRLRPVHDQLEALRERLRVMADGPHGLPAMAELSALRASSRAVEAQLRQLHELEGELQRLQSVIAEQVGQIHPGWLQPLPGGAAQRPLEQAALSVGVLQAARAYEARLDAGQREVAARQNDVQQQQRALHQAASLLQENGWTPAQSQADIEQAEADLARELAVCDDEMERLNELQRLWSQYEATAQEIAAYETAAGPPGRRKTRRSGRWLPACVAFAAFALAVIEVWQGAPVDGVLTAGFGLVLTAVLIGLGRRQGAAAHPPADAHLERLRVQRGQQEAALLQTARRLTWHAEAFAALWSVQQPTSEGFDAARLSNAWAEQLQTAKASLRERTRRLNALRDGLRETRQALLRWEAARDGLEEAQAKLAAAQAQLEQTDAAWQDFLTEVGLPKTAFHPNAFVVEANVVLSIRTAQAALAKQSEQAEELRNTIVQFLDATAAFAPAARGGEPAARDASALQRAFDVRMEGLNRALQMAADGEALQQEIREWQVQANTLAGGEASYTEKAVLLRETSEATWTDRLQSLEAQVSRLRALLQASQERQWQLTQALRSWQDGQETAHIVWQLAQTRARRDAIAHQWAAHVIAHQLVRQARQQFERAQQPALLKAAGALFARMTAGKYVDLLVLGDEEGAAGEAWFAVDAQGTHWRIDALSRGTREQIYLAMRLALIRAYQRRGTILPVVLDDPLVNFDSLRLAAVFAMLNEEAQSGQMLYLTCHKSVVELAESAGVPVVSLTGVE